MRASEARLTLSVVSLRGGDIDGAAEWAGKAFTTDRRSVIDLSTIAGELYLDACDRYGDDPAVRALKGIIAS